MNSTPVFYDILNSKAKLVILQGGTSSSKTYSAIQYAIHKAVTEKDKVITITGESIPNLKKGAYRDIQHIISSSEWVSQKVKEHNLSDRIFTFVTGAKIEFTSNQDEQSAKAGKRDILIVDEADGLPYPIFWQLAIRTREKIIVAYNPTIPFWIHSKFKGTTPEENDLHATVEYFRSWHEHNTFLSEEEHEKIEGIKDKELWRVYARGLTGNLTGIIFPDWIEAPFPENHDYYFYGLDIGWTEDASKTSGNVALMKMCKIGKSLFVDELLSDIQKTPKDVIQILRANKYSDEMVYCDHNREFIRELRQFEVMAVPARKGPGSTYAGIMKLKEVSVFYSPRSKNLKENLGKYKWIIDRDTGKPTNAPIDAFNDEIDAVRMGNMSHYWRE